MPLKLGLGLSPVLGGGAYGSLLDATGPPAVAFSTRKLSTAYSGQCLRVRRSTDSAEQDIGFAAGKLDTAALLSFVGAGDGFVTTWYDQSGNARDATQSTAAKQPYVAQSGAVTTIGGQGDAAIVNPAANRFLSYSLADDTDGFSALMVVRYPTTLAGKVSWNLRSSGPFWRPDDGSGNTGLLALSGTTPSTPTSTAARAFVASWTTSVKTLRSSAGTTNLTEATGFAVGSGLIGNFSDGSGGPADAHFHTCVLWTAPLSDVDVPYSIAVGWI